MVLYCSAGASVCVVFYSLPVYTIVNPYKTGGVFILGYMFLYETPQRVVEYHFIWSMIFNSYLAHPAEKRK